MQKMNSVGASQTRLPAIIMTRTGTSSASSTNTTAGGSTRDVLFPAVGSPTAPIHASTASANGTVGAGSARDIFNIPIDPRNGQRLVAERKEAAGDADAMDIPVTHPSKCADASKFLFAVQPVVNLVVLLLVAMLVVNTSTSAAQMSALETRLDALQRTCERIQLALSSQFTNISNSVATHAADISISVAAHAANISNAVAVHAAASAAQIQLALSSQSTNISNSVATHAADISISVAAHAANISNTVAVHAAASAAQIQLALSNQSTSISNSVATHATEISSSVAAHAANISNAVAVHAAASAESSQLALRAENNTLNNILGRVVDSGSSLQTSILQTQVNLQQVNQSIASFVSSLASSPALATKKYTSACRSGFLPDVDWKSEGIGQGCIWHSGKTIFNLGVNGTGPFGLVNKPNLTVTFSCTYASAWGGGPVAPAISVSTPDLNWLSTSSNTACDGAQKSFVQSYPGSITLPALATATIVWTWCGIGDASVTINSMCARVDWT
jgi:hypothetical protein